MLLGAPLSSSLFRTHGRARLFLTALLLVFGLVGCQPSGDDPTDESRSKENPGQVTTERLRQANEEPGQWMTAGRNFQEHHHSPLDQINAQNAGRLGLAWEQDARNALGTTPRGLEATPVVVDGTMYTSGAWGVVYAIDAKTGRRLWRYVPDVDGSYARRACCDVVNRGVEVRNGTVYVGTLDGYLVALDARTGSVRWKVDTITDRSDSYTITSSPQIAGGKVVIGNSGAEYGVRGYVTAYDTASGDQAWRFYTVPGDPDEGFEHPAMKMAAKTWDPNSKWEAGGGGTVWGEMAYDPELNLLYVGTGNATPYPQEYRSPGGGDNLFLASILAINPDTGRLEWYYQTTPGEQWDYTATQHMILAEMQIDGRQRKVLMQAPKNGFFYVLDRKTGEFISAEPYVTVTWAEGIDPETGRPILAEQGDYGKEPKLIYPSMVGGHNWQPMSYHPGTGLVYIPEIDFPNLLKLEEDFEHRPAPSMLNMGIDGAFPPLPDSLQKYAEGQPPNTEWQERLVAWDPAEQKEVWSAPREAMFNGGVLSTGGNLVIQGTASGYLKVHHARTGELLKEIQVGTGIMAGPMTYTVADTQYVAVMAGYGGARLNPYGPNVAAQTYQNYGRILAFKLDGGPVPLPPKVDIPEEVPKPPDLETTAEQIQNGEELYSTHCARCHAAVRPDNNTGYPSLALLTRELHKEFSDIVLEGTMSSRGMAGYSDVLSGKDAEAIQAYIISRQRELRQED
jgi:quinohemoprotein ethanol dehydrogenase